jgi:sec-independent protein translocase protein TatB
MFDLAWSEIVLIGVVALIAIGPKDLPVAMKAVTEVIKKARRMAAEFQTHVDDMMRDANLDEVRQSINEIRNFDIKGTVERAVDPDGKLRETFASNPLEPQKDPTGDPPAAPQPVIEAAEAVPAEPLPDAPAFIPPEFAAKCVPPPAFVPPGTMAPSSYYSTGSRA